ncbi:MAG: PD-(D/E)XK nuclease family protein, partial [Bdellovibrionales bacterium]
MLKVIEATSLKNKYNYLIDFNPEKDTWVTSDIHSKSFVQNQLLKKQKCLPEDAVLRVSELWSKIVFRSFSEVEVTSSQFVTTFLTEWLRSKDIPWARHAGTPKLLLNYIGEFLPIICREDLIEIAREWMSANPETILRWGNWFELSVKAWQFFCEEQIISSTWMSAYLAGNEWSQEVWNRNLYIDFGADLNGIEIDLIRKLSLNNNVTVFSPEESWIKKFHSSLWPYEILLKHSQSSKKKYEIKDVEWIHNDSKNVQVFRHTTQLAEVKSAVAIVREKLNQNIKIEDIGILAADIEDYWPSLSAYLQKEGIPVAKATVARLGSFELISRWLSRLKIESRDVQSGNLEHAFYQPQRAPVMEYAKFHQLFARIYDIDDLSRDKNVQKYFEFRFESKDKLLRDDFFSWALKYWNEGSYQNSQIELLEKISSKFLNECPPQTKLELRSWLSYLADVITKIEISLNESSEKGLNCSNFDAAQNMELKHVILLGLCEDQLNTSSDLSISSREIQKLATDTGVFLESPDQKYNAYLAEQISSRCEDVILSFAATDFSGSIHSPSLLWIEKSYLVKKQSDRYDVSGMTRWDEIQLQYDAENLAQKQMTYFATPGLKYSASQIEKYLECPFIFSAEKLFRLSSYPDIDLDMDAMSNGKMIHALLERLLEEPADYNQSEDKILNLIDFTRKDIDLRIADERLWNNKKLSYLRIAKNFLSFEKEWRKQFPKTTTVARELKISGDLILNSDKTITVTGKIDRVDFSEGEYAIIDYKSTPSDYHSYAGWLDHNEIQLAFYSMVIEQGLTELQPGQVVGAFYYILSKMDREKGFRIRGQGENLFQPNTRNRSMIDADALSQLMTDVKLKIL